MGGATESVQTPRATVVIVDDDKVLCDLLAKRLDGEADIAFRGMAQTPAVARQLVEEQQPDVILLDGVGFHNRWPDDRRIDPIAFGGELIRLSPASHLLLWTGWNDPSPGRERELGLRVRARRSGAEDFVLKGAGLDVLLERIRAALARGIPSRNSEETTSDPMMETIIELMGDGTEAQAAAGTEADLTPAQRKWAVVIARGWEAGMTVPEIAEVYHVAETTLRKHAQDTRNTWNVHNSAQFVSEARRRGLLG